MKKKLLAGILGMTMVLSLVACGDKETAEYKDGKYAVESKADDKGWKGTLTVEIKDGKIDAAEYFNVNAEGAKKRDDAAYNEKMKGISGSSPAEFEPALEKSLVEKQSSEVDTVTGATSSSDAFKVLAAKALENAKAGNTELTVVE